MGLYGESPAGRKADQMEKGGWGAKKRRKANSPPGDQPTTAVKRLHRFTTGVTHPGHDVGMDEQIKPKGDLNTMKPGKIPDSNVQTQRRQGESIRESRHPT